MAGKAKSGKAKSTTKKKRSAKSRTVSKHDLRKFFLLLGLVILLMTVVPYTFMKARPAIYKAMGKPVPVVDTTSVVYKMYNTDLRDELGRRVETLKTMSASGIDLTEEQKVLLEEYQLVQGEVSSFAEWLFAKNTVYELIRDIMLSMFFYFMGVLQGKARGAAMASKG